MDQVGKMVRGLPKRLADMNPSTRMMLVGLIAAVVVVIVADGGPGRKVYSPGHPDADADGFVTFPDVNPVHEVVNLMSASRAYDVNVVVVEMLKQMAARGLEITK